MKRGFVYSVSLLLVLVAFASCKKYDEGPNVSLLSKEDRVKGDWKVTSMTENDQDVMGSTTRIEYDFNDGTYIYRREGGLLPSTHSGTWVFTNNAESLTLTNTSGPINSSETWKILRLTHNEMVLEQTEDGVTTRMEMENR